MFQNGCAQPIWLHIEEQSKNPIFVDEFTEVILFQQLKWSSSNKAIIGKEEVSQFFEQILGVKEKCKLDVEWLIQWYDGATWVYTKGDKFADRYKWKALTLSHKISSFLCGRCP